MSCETVTNCLSTGQPLSGSAQDHLQGCPACRSMISVLNEAPETPSAGRLESIRELVTKDLTPVRPLPSDAVMMLISILIFVLFSCVATVPVGFAGLHHLAAGERLAYYGTILICSVLFSIAVIQEMIPGSKRRVDPMLAGALSLLLLILSAVVIFRDFAMADFVKSGTPCLRLGCLCAAAGAFLAYLFVRNGYSVSPLRTASITGLFAGLAGFAVLALHCPIQNSAHVIVWHVGAIVVGGLGGAGLSWAWRARTQRITSGRS